MVSFLLNLSEWQKGYFNLSYGPDLNLVYVLDRKVNWKMGVPIRQEGVEKYCTMGKSSVQFTNYPFGLT